MPVNSKKNLSFFERNRQRKTTLPFSSLQIVSAVFAAAGFIMLVYFLWRPVGGLINSLLLRSQFFEGIKLAPNNTKDITVRPIGIAIPSLKINAPMVPLGLNSDGALEVPSSDKDVGWYVEAPVPGEVGSSILVGHLDSYFGTGVFYNLKNIKPGDTFSVERSDGIKAVFKVDKKETYPQNSSFPAQLVYAPTNYPSVKIITCSGKYNHILRRYEQNLVVYATLDRIEKP